MWQDEWYGLTIEDIRKLEEETQRILARKMGTLLNPAIMRRSSQNRESDQEEGFANEGRGSVVYVQDGNDGIKLETIANGSPQGVDGSVCLSPVAITVEKFGYDAEDQGQVFPDKLTQKSTQCNGISSEGSIDRRLARTDYLKGYRMSTIETVDSDSEDDEFFDAQGKLQNNTQLLHEVFVISRIIRLR